MSRSPARRVYEKNGSWHYVDMARKWHKLCRVKEGLPAMFRALAALTEREADSDTMPAVVSRWLESRRPDWVAKWALNMEAKAAVISDSFAEFTPAQVTTPVCAKFLSAFAGNARTHNIYRNVLSQVLAYAAVEGLREGHNPLANIKGKSTPGRRRIVTDAEILALKKAAMEATRNGEALVQMIDLAMLTGQRIGDLVNLRWQDIGPEGVSFRQGKTDERLLVQWSPALQAAVDACDRGHRIGHVLKTQSGTGFKYAGMRSSWDRACERAGIKDLHIHDLRGRAGVDALLADGIAAAQGLLGHRGEAMTRHYTHGKYAQRVKPSK